MADSEVDISFIIPTHNRASKLCNAMESVIGQTDCRWELIIVDDGSTDNTFHFVQPYLKDDRIRYIRQARGGVSTARNRGAEIAGGDFLIFLDSDDIVFPALIQELYQNNFLEYDLSCWEVIKEIDGKLSKRKPINLGRAFNDLKATFLAGSVCYSRKIFWRAGGYDPLMTFGENYELGLRISEQKDLKICYLDKPFLKYTVNSEKRTSNSLSNRLTSHLYQYKKHKEKYNRDIRAKATLNYLIAFVFEKKKRNSAAIEYYKNSWFCTPWNLKPVLKIIYIKLFK